VSDGLASVSSTVTINVFNTAPEAYGSSETILRDQTLSSYVSGYDIDADPVTFSLALGPGNGTLSLGSDGSYTYTPNAGHVGSDSFDYSASDGIAVDSATVTIDVYDPYLLNAVDDSIHGTSSSLMIIEPLINDTGVEIFIESASSESGTVALLDLDTNGYADAIEFQSWQHITEGAYLEYTIQDQNGGTDSAVIFVTFQPPVENNNPPVFRRSPTNSWPAVSYDFTYYVGRESAGYVYATDVDGDLVTYSSNNNGPPFVVAPIDGAVRPTRGFTQAEIGSTFQISASATDGRGGVDNIWVNVTIAGPVHANDDAFTLEYVTAFDQEVIVSPYSVLGNDRAQYGQANVQLVQQPQHGSVTLSNDGFFTYQRSGETFQDDSFTYRLIDQVSGITSNAATVNLTFRGTTVPAPNVEALDDHFYGTIDPDVQSYTFGSVVANDTVPDGENPTVATLVQPRFGTFQLAADGTSGSYTPNNPNFSAITEIFQYKLTVGNEESIATIHIHFSEPPNTGPNTPQLTQGPPQFGSPYYVFHFTGGQTLGDITASDPDGDVVTFWLNSAPAWMSHAPLNATTFRISVANNQQPVVGIHSFTALVTDNNTSASGQLQTDIATIIVLVDPAGGQNQAPEFQADIYNVTLTVEQIENATTTWISTNQSVLATDPQNQTVTYFVPSAGTSFGNPISVHPTTGEILVNVGAILEPNSNHAIVVASDTDGYTDTAQIHVAIHGLAGYMLYVEGTNDSHAVAGNDVAQGGLPNCWFQSVLASVADQSPQVIQAMIADLGTHNYEVRFFQRNQQGQLQPVWVPVQFNPQGAAGVAIGADVDPVGRAEIWPRIIEMAYIQFVGGSGNVGGGVPATAWEMITGFPANATLPLSELTAERVEQELTAGRLIWVGTKPGPILVGGLAPSHIYSVVSIEPDPSDPSRYYVALENPHGTNNATLAFVDLLTAIHEWWIQ